MRKANFSLLSQLSSSFPRTRLDRLYALNSKGFTFGTVTWWRSFSISATVGFSSFRKCDVATGHWTWQSFCQTSHIAAISFSGERLGITWQFAHVLDILFGYHIGCKHGINTGQIYSGCVDGALKFAPPESACPGNV